MYEIQPKINFYQTTRLHKINTVLIYIVLYGPFPIDGPLEPSLYGFRDI